MFTIPQFRNGSPALFFVFFIAFSSLILGVFSLPTEPEVSDFSHLSEMTSEMTNTATKALRFPSDGQTAEQKSALAEAARIAKQIYGSSYTLEDAQGNLLGPFGILSYTPKSFLGYLNYTQQYATLPYITAKERELCTLATVSVTKSAYINYAHQKIGISVGLTKEQVERASKGHVPKKLTDREELVYELALDIAKDFGFLKTKDFKEAVSVIGREGIAQVAQMVGGYMLSSVLVTVADVAVPKS
jgi:hypothetical protein